MTKPDAIKLQRNSLAALAVLALSTSFTTAYLAAFWVQVLDYWLIFGSIATGVGGLIYCITATIAHMVLLDTGRDN